MDDKQLIEKGKKIHDILVKASKDNSFKKELKTNTQNVFKKEGIEIDKSYKIEFFENTATDFYLTVPIHKYPSELELRILPKNAAFEDIVRWVVTQIQGNTPLKTELLSNPEAVLKKYGAGIPEKMKVHIQINSDKIHYLVIPRDTTDNDEVSDLELQAIAGGAANAYSHGSTIHVSPGQEKYLPHEAWHVKQQ